MKNKKIAIILISVVAAAALMVGGIIVLSEASASTLDITDEVAGYYVISVNPAVEIAVGAGGNVISVSGQNDDGKEILTGSDFSGMWAGEAIERVLGLIREAGYLGSSGFYDEITIGYFSDAGEKSKDEILALVPEEYRDICIVTALTGNAAQRSGVSLKAPLDTTMATTSAPSDTPGITSDATDTPEPSPSGTPEETGTSSKKNGSGSDDGVINPRFDLSVSISGGNAVFTWNKLKFVDFMYGQMNCLPKATTTAKEDKPSVAKKFTSESTTSWTVSLSSLGISPSSEKFYFLYEYDNDPRFRCDNGTYAPFCTNMVSIRRMQDGSYKAYNNNPSPYGHGEVGVDYFAPTMSISETVDSLQITWKDNSIIPADFKGVTIYISESSTAPGKPDGCTNCRYLGSKYTSYLLKLSDFSSVGYGKTYYFTIYGHFATGAVIKGNTISAKVPDKKELANVSLSYNNTYRTANFMWPDPQGSNIKGYKLVIEYSQEGSSDRTALHTETWTYGEYNYESNKYRYSYSFGDTDGKVFYIRFYTQYTDGYEKHGVEHSHTFPVTETPTPEPSPSESPTETATETPTEAPTAEPTPSPAEEPTQEITPEPTPTPTETDSGGTEG